MLIFDKTMKLMGVYIFFSVPNEHLLTRVTFITEIEAAAKMGCEGWGFSV
jgi:hypothetical protein